MAVQGCRPKARPPAVPHQGPQMNRPGAEDRSSASTRGGDHPCRSRGGTERTSDRAQQGRTARQKPCELCGSSGCGNPRQGQMSGQDLMCHSLLVDGTIPFAKAQRAHNEGKMASSVSHISLLMTFSITSMLAPFHHHHHHHHHHSARRCWPWASPSACLRLCFASIQAR